MSEARAEVQRLQSEMSSHRSRIDFNWQRAQEISELIERYGADITAAETKRHEQANKIQQTDALIASTTELLESKQNELNELSQRAAQLRSERAAREAELQALQGTLGKGENRIAALTDEVTGMKARRDATLSRIDELAREIGSASAARDQAQAALGNARNAHEHEQATVEGFFNAFRAAEGQLLADQKALGDAEKEFFRIERAIAEKSSRLDILRQLNEEGEGLAKGSQAVLKGLDDPKRIRPALAGALVSSLNVDREFVPALEAALGRNMHAVVLQNPEFAPEILRHVTKHSLGQAALALPELAASTSDDHLVDLPDDAVAWAIDKVNAPAAVAPLVRRLLRGVVIVQEFETAVRLKREHPVLQFATLAGEFISTAGVIFGGTANSNSTSLLGRNVLISDTAAELQHLATERGGTSTLCEDKRSIAASALAELEAARGRHQTAHLEQSHSAAQVLLLEHQLRAAEDRVQRFAIERSTLEQQTGFAAERIAQLEEELSALIASVTEQQARKVAAADANEQARLREEETAEVLQTVRLAVATERQRHESLLSQRQPMTAREAELGELIDARRSDIARYERRLELQSTESEQAEAALTARQADLAVAEENVSAISAKRAALLGIVNRGEAELRAVRSSLDKLHDARGQEQVRQTQLQLRVENLLERVTRRYQVDLREFARDQYGFQKTLRVQLKRRAVPDSAIAGVGPEANGFQRSESSASSQHDAASGNLKGHAPEESGAPLESDALFEVEAAQLETIIADLTRQLDNMGPVNLDAVHEYDELEERHRFLEAQNNDLSASKKELLDVITRINSTTQKLFAETFSQVQINFREMFAELFGGGRAGLSLVDESDPLNCGIDIVAKPPGKQLQSISLLSGGERTMTAVALLFAIYMVRPSPFCILDEMDAPLDESNINRFIKMLDRFVEQSQFIIITHNKRTIARAAVLYGVTMEERGVSKLVGMRLAADRGSDGQLKAPPRNGATQRHHAEEPVEQELALSR
ncbi:MAG: hypothetical protein H0T95_08185 [Chthoniobacterales bacterium]|nr:hypothetical protein [Chthoniobacterales bacterium]